MRGNLKRYTGENYWKDLEGQISSWNFVPVETPKNMSVGKFIEALYRAADSYPGDKKYSFNPSGNGDDYNSNSFVSGIILAAGGTPPDLGPVTTLRTPGYLKPLPIDVIPYIYWEPGSWDSTEVYGPPVPEGFYEWGNNHKGYDGSNSGGCS